MDEPWEHKPQPLIPKIQIQDSPGKRGCQVGLWSLLVVTAAADHLVPNHVECRSRTAAVTEKGMDDDGDDDDV